MNFLTGQAYAEAMRQIVHKAHGGACAAVAFWGKGVLIRISEWPQGSRIICNLGAGGTDPGTIKALRDQGLSVRFKNDLHAKVIVGHKMAIVGSANMSAMGMGGGSNSGWSEAGVRIESLVELRRIQSWFEAEWAEAEEVDELNLEIAEAMWKQRSSGLTAKAWKTRIRDAKLLLKPEEWASDHTYLVLVKQESTNTRIQQMDASDTERLGVPVSSYQGWPKLPKDRQLISYFLPQRGSRKFGLDGMYFSDGKLWEKGGRPGASRQGCVAQEFVVPAPGSRRRLWTHSLELAYYLVPHLSQIWNWPDPNGDRTGKCFDMVKVVEALKQEHLASKRQSPRKVTAHAQ